jgi:hypothetical protein
VVTVPWLISPFLAKPLSMGDSVMALVVVRSASLTIAIVPVRPSSFDSPPATGVPKYWVTASVSSSSLVSPLLVTRRARGRSTLMAALIVMVAVSMTETRLCANSATNSFLPVGDSASAIGSAPTVTVASTAGVPPLIPVTRTTVPSARFAT